MGRQIVECLVWADGIIGRFPVLQSWIKTLQVKAGVCYLVEFFCVSSIRPLHVAIEFWRAWRQEYNRQRPHGALGNLTPVEFARVREMVG